VARQLGRRQWLPFHAGQSCINASPTWSAGCPDRHCRAGKIRIIKGPNPNEDQMRACLGLAKERRTATWAESAVHSTTAVGHAKEVTRRPGDLESLRTKASANRSAACAQILAIAAPAHARSNRRFSALPTNRPAKAPACHCHCALHGQALGNTVPQIVLLAVCSFPAMPRNPSPPSAASAFR
jgi:hypothetical protein